MRTSPFARAVAWVLALASAGCGAKGSEALRPRLLSHRELQVLQHLAERAGKVVTRDELLQAVWGYRDTPLTRSVDLAVARLRRKIEPDPRHPRFMRTLHGDGYCLTP